MNIYTIRDSKTEQYMAPQFLLTHGEAIRAISDAMGQGESALSSHPEDFALFHLGEFDRETGIIKAHAPSHVINLVDLAPTET